MQGDDKTKEASAEVLPPTARSLVSLSKGRVFDDEGRQEAGASSTSLDARPPGLFVRLVSLAALLSGAALVASAAGFDPLHWLQTSGLLGAAVFVALVACVTPLMVPSGLLAVIPGYLWGATEGTSVVLAGAALGGVTNMWLARSFLAPKVERWAVRFPALLGVRDGIRTRGFRLALALRMSPITPYSLLAYFAGVAGMPYRSFVAASVLGGIPWTFVYASAGALAASAQGGLHPSQVEVHGPWWLRWLGFALTVGVAIWTGRLARRELRKAMSEGAQ